MNKVSGTNFKKTKLIHSGKDVHIYEGLHAKFGRQVVIKELSGEASEIIREDFFKEAKLWAKFKHPRLGLIEEINEDRGWVVAEYCPAALNQRISEGFNLALLKDLVMQIFDGLGHLHTQGFLHCNLSSQNIRFCDGNEAIKILDGRGVSIDKASQLPRPRGSNKFRAPEMLDNRFGPVGMATDLYLTAMVLLEALAGNRFESLFQGYVEGTPDPETGWFRWHNSEDELEPVKGLIPGLPEGFAKLLDGMLSKNVRSRIGSVRDAIADLKAVEMVGQLGSPEPVQATVVKNNTHAPDRGAAPQAPSNSLTNSAGTSPQLISRPTAPAYVRIASGTMAGTIIPLEMEDVVIGEGENCNVRLSANDYEKIRGREVSISLGAGGWKVSEIKRPEDFSENILVSGQPCRTNLPVRSGDIICLSSTGPDLQFVIQGQATWTWQDVADELNMGGSQTPAKPKPRSRPPVGSGTIKTGSVPASAPSGQNRPSTAPKAATPPRSDRVVQPPLSASERPAATANSFAPAPPSASKGAKTKAAKAKGAKTKSSKVSQANNSSHVKAAESGGISEWFSDKDKRNWLILAGGLLLTAIIVPLAMGGGGGTEDNQKKTEEIVDPEIVDPIEGSTSGPNEAELTDEANAGDSELQEGNQEVAIEPKTEEE